MAAAVLVAGCSNGEPGSSGDRPTIVVTTSILGDVVSRVVGDAASVTVVMPPGADPHDFQPSARQVAELRSADVVVINGGGFEEGLADIIESAQRDDVATFDAAAAGGGDPHFFTSPPAMRGAVSSLGGFLAEELPAIAGDVRTGAASYVVELDRLDAEIEAVLEPVPAARRKLITNHDVFGAFAERYGFEVIGTVLPGPTTNTGGAAGRLAELAAAIERAGVPAVFADESSSHALADAVAGEVQGVEVVGLFTESLGPAGSEGASYVEMMRTNARRIAAALA